MKHLMLHFSRGGTHGSSDRLNQLVVVITPLITPTIPGGLVAKKRHNDQQSSRTSC